MIFQRLYLSGEWASEHCNVFCNISTEMPSFVLAFLKSTRTICFILFFHIFCECMECIRIWDSNGMHIAPHKHVILTHIYVHIKTYWSEPISKVWTIWLKMLANNMNWCMYQFHVKWNSIPVQCTKYPE